MTVTELPFERTRVFDGCEGLSAPDVLRSTGITYRQLDYWTRTKRIKCHHHAGDKVVNERGGSGSWGCWLPDQVKIIGRVAALLRRGLQLDHAFVLATNRQATAAMLCELTYIQADLIEEEDRADE